MEPIDNKLDCIRACLPPYRAILRFKRCYPSALIDNSYYYVTIRPFIGFYLQVRKYSTGEVKGYINSLYLLVIVLVVVILLL